jgi:hypothetical protein
MATPDPPTGRRSAFTPDDFGTLPVRVRSRLAARLSERDPAVLLVAGAHTLNAVPFNVQMARTPVGAAEEPVFKSVRGLELFLYGQMRGSKGYLLVVK